MKLQKTPNEWSCLVTAYAMCMDVPVQELLDELPDGSEESFPEQDGTKQRRGHHPQELLDQAIARGFALMEIEVDPVIGYGEEELVHVFKDGEARAKVIMNLGFPSVICGLTSIGNGHAVAYDPGNKIYYDPRGHELHQCPITMDLVFLVLRNKIP